MNDDPTRHDVRVQQAMAGDKAELAQLFEQHRDRLRRMVELRMDRRVQGRVNASDVLQDAYVDLAQQITNYKKDPRLPFFLWVRRITGQRLAKAHREHLGAAMRDAGREVSLYRGGMPQASSMMLASRLVGRFTSAGARAIRTEKQMMLQEVLNSMDADDREILALRHFEELDNVEIAALLELSTSGATRRYYRALRRFQAAIEQVPELQQ